MDAASPQSFLLTWSHYRTLLQVDDEVARQWYENEATREVWSVKTLQRNISSQYYYRMLQTHRKDFVEEEMKEKISVLYLNDQLSKDEYEDKIVSRPFAVAGGVTYYGNVIEKSMYDVAKAIKDDGFRGLTAAQQSYVQRVIDYVEEN